MRALKLIPMIPLGLVLIAINFLIIIPPMIAVFLRTLMDGLNFIPYRVFGEPYFKTHFFRALVGIFHLPLALMEALEKGLILIRLPIAWAITKVANLKN